MGTLIGIWTTAELLADTVRTTGSESSDVAREPAPMLAAFQFLPMTAAQGRCVVKGRHGHNGMWELIPTDLWLSLEIDPIAAAADDNAEYSEARAHPRILGPDYYMNLWNDLRWQRFEIEALRPSFKAWYESEM